MKPASEKALLRLEFSSHSTPPLHENIQSHTSNSPPLIFARMALDYHAVLGTDLFTFLLGPEEVPINIHEGVVKNLSQPLYALMTNGMKESAERKAKIDDIDSRTFALFAEYAYTGAYRLPPSGEESGDLAGSIETPQKRKLNYCKKCGSKYGDNSSCGPNSCAWIRTVGGKYSGFVDTYCSYCKALVKGSSCKTCSELLTNGGTFLEREYDTKELQHEQLRSFLERLSPPDEPSNHLIAHARLFIFADRYLIESLKGLCLHKLHRDLVCFKLTDAMAPELFELLDFTDKNTEGDTETAEEDVETDLSKDLRDLVVAYAALQAKKLVEYDAFKVLLTEGGDLFTELFCQIAKRLKD